MIFIKIALISYLLAIVLFGATKIQLSNMNEIDLLLENYGKGACITAVLFYLSLLCGVISSILAVIFWK